MRGLRATRHSDRAALLMHAGCNTQVACGQRAQRQRAEDSRRIQGIAWPRLRLLFGRQAFAADDEIALRCEGFPYGKTVDDQSLIFLKFNGHRLRWGGPMSHDIQAPTVVSGLARLETLVLTQASRLAE